MFYTRGLAKRNVNEHFRDLFSACRGENRTNVLMMMLRNLMVVNSIEKVFIFIIISKANEKLFLLNGRFEKNVGQEN